jgi:hypothetical protein
MSASPPKHAMSEIKQTPNWLRPVVEYGPIAAFFNAYCDVSDVRRVRSV